MKRLAVLLFALALGTLFGIPAGAGEPPPIYVLEWGGYGFGPGQFDSPGGIGLDSLGNVYVADIFNQRVQKFDSEGNYLMEWGSPGTGDGQFHDPGYLAVDESDQIYVVDVANNRVQVFDINGNFLRKWGSGGSGPGQFVIPWGIEVKFGKVYVADYNQHRVQVFDTNGNFITLRGGTVGSGDGEFNNPADVAVDSAGNIYVSDFNNHRIQKFDSNFDFLTTWGSLGNGDGEFNWPKGIEVDLWDGIYVTEYANCRVQKFDTAGSFLTKWGMCGSGPSEFVDAFDVATNELHEIFVSESWQSSSPNYRVQKFSQATGSGYVTDFESFNLGTIDGQDGWWITGGLALGDGMIVDDTTGNLLLQVTAGEDWGEEVNHALFPLSERFVVAEMDFQTKDGGGPFWFVDFVPGPSDSIYWWPTSAQSNANPGIGGFSFDQDTWHHIGIEIDQQSREITAVDLNGRWMVDDDSDGISDPAQLNRFYFRGTGAEERLWIDNISIRGFDTSVILLDDGFECGDCSGWSVMVP